MRITHIFDLDGTLIDSSHRASYKNGVLDLQAWRTNNTREQILRDTITPLGQDLTQAIAFNPKLEKQIIILTARDCVPADYELLKSLGLGSIGVLSRHGLPQKVKDLPDHKLKAWLIENSTHLELADGCQFYDDIVENLTELKERFNISPILVQGMGSACTKL